MANFVERFITGAVDTLSASIRRFSAFGLILFFLGTLYGENIERISAAVGIDKILLSVTPLLLAVIAFFVTEIAVVLFIILLIASMFFFI